MTGQDKISVAPSGNYGCTLDDGFGQIHGPRLRLKSVQPVVSGTPKVDNFEYWPRPTGAAPMSEYILIDGWFTGDHQYTVAVTAKDFPSGVLTEIGTVTATNAT